MTSALLLVTLITLYAGTTAVLEQMPQRPLYKRLVVAGVIFVGLALTFAVYPSDPREWDVGRFVLYLAEPRFEVLAILGNIITGSLMFGVFVWGIYWANRSR